jgi:hypothetical protein
MENPVSANNAPSQRPARTADTMSMAIAISSPSGRMSKAARKRAEKQLVQALFGNEGLSVLAPKLPPQPSKKDSLLREAKNLRELAARGMKPRAFVKEALKLEAEAATL